MRKCKFKMTQDGKEILFCTESCLTSYKSKGKPKPTAELKLKDMSSAMNKDVSKEVPTVQAPGSKVFVRKCSECHLGIKANDEKVLTWETMEFCKEECLGRFLIYFIDED